MSKTLTLDDISHLNDSQELTSSVTPAQLLLVVARVPMRACEYRISNTRAEMLATESTAISLNGIMFPCTRGYPKDTLMRIWIELPNYWARKSKHVEYRHTDAPQHFQVLARVLKCEETPFGNMKFQVFCENLNIDPVDELILQEYLHTNSGGSKK